VVGRSSWASVRPGPDSDPGSTLVAPSALKSAYFSALRKKQLVDRQNRPKLALTSRRSGQTFFAMRYDTVFYVHFFWAPRCAPDAAAQKIGHLS
jgi:hypothetical protein